MKYGVKSFEPEPNAGSLRFLLVIGVLLTVAIVIVLILGCVSGNEGPKLGARKPPVTEGHSPARVQDFKGHYYYAGMPKVTAYPNPLQVLTNIGYVVAYDNVRKDPAWVCYRVFKVDNLKPPPRPSRFSVDTRTTARVSSKDYTGSGYDRGHGAPNRAIGVCYGEQAQLQTFLMSNILPQLPALNEQVWERVEDAEIADYAQRFGTLWVITGPVFDTHPKRLACGVAIPDSCYKIMVREDKGRVKVLAFEVPQSVKGSEKPHIFLQTVRKIEQGTGLDFLSELPKDVEDKAEAYKASAVW